MWRPDFHFSIFAQFPTRFPFCLLYPDSFLYSNISEPKARVRNQRNRFNFSLLRPESLPMIVRRFKAFSILR